MNGFIHSPGTAFIFPPSVYSYAAIFIVSATPDMPDHFVMIDKDGFPHLYVHTLTKNMCDYFVKGGGRVIEP
jgi:hypothetical protein